MGRTNEQAREYMKAWRARQRELKRATLPVGQVHAACDTRIAELEAIVAAQNEEIGQLKQRSSAEPDELDSIL